MNSSLHFKIVETAYKNICNKIIFIVTEKRKLLL